MKIYRVGGAVRDSLLGFPGSDNDYVVTGATPKMLLNAGFEQVGHDFPVFLHPKTHEEFALARTERKQGHGYLGFVCDFSPEISLSEDLRRRDLTVNAMAREACFKGDPVIEKLYRDTGSAMPAEDACEISDPWGGMADLKNRVLRHVSPAFVEDPLRVLRVARFAARFYHLGFSIAPETLALMREISESGELCALTPERVWAELYKALCTRNPEIFIEVLRKCGALHDVLPEVDALYGVPGPKRWHPEIDSGVHTCMTLARVSAETEDPVVRFAMLCHDLGKARTPVTQWPHHRNHHVLGVAPLRELCLRLKVPKDYESFAFKVVRYHSEMHHVYRGGPEGLVTLMDTLDAWRRPDLIKPWVICCKCDFLGRLGFGSRPFPRADYFLALFSLLRTVNAKEFLEQGFKGPEIREQMHRRRVELAAEFLKTLPKSELDDSANEMPPYGDVRWRPITSKDSPAL